MANVTTRTKRAFVRWARLGANESVALVDVFRGLLTARVSQTRTGLVLKTTAANGHTSQFDFDESMTSGDARDLAEELLTRYEEAVAQLGGTPTDDEIHDEMLRALGDPIRRLRSDFSGLCP